MSCQLCGEKKSFKIVEMTDIGAVVMCQPCWKSFKFFKKIQEEKRRMKKISEG